MGNETPQKTFTIGRAPECDLVLADQSISRTHAQLVLLQDGQLYLVDCQSTHGTRLSHGGQTRRIQQEFIAPDAVVSFGDVSLSVPDMIDAIRTRHPGLPAPRFAAAGSPPVRSGRTWAQGTRLVRCACGVVKPKGQRCPECGE